MTGTDKNQAATTPFLSRLGQVVMTCVAHRWLLLGYSIGFLLCGLSRFGRSTPLSETGGGLGIHILLLGGILALGMVAKYWFTRPEAKLTPGYAEAHLLPLILYLVFHFFALPLFFIAPTLKIDPIGTAALSACLCAMLLMGFDKPVFFFPLMGFVGSASVPGINEFWFANDLPYQPHRIILLVAGWCLVGYWMIRQATMNEESDGYGIPQVAIAFGTASKQLRTQQNQVTAKQLEKNVFWANLTDHSTDRFLKQKNLNLEKLLGESFYTGPFPAGAIMAFLMMGMMGLVIVGFQYLLPENGEVWPFLIQPLTFALVMPGMMNFTLWGQKNQPMASEILRPNGRETYFYLLFKNSLRHTLHASVAFSLGCGLLVSIFYPSILNGYSLICFLFTIIASNLLFYGFSILGAAFRSKIMGWILVMIPMGIGMLAYGGFTTYHRAHFYGPKKDNFVFMSDASVYLPLLLGNLIAILVAVLVIRIAYRKWLRTEIG